MGDYIKLSGDYHSVQVVREPPGFTNVCCAFCCLITGCFGTILCGLFALALATRFYVNLQWELNE